MERFQINLNKLKRKNLSLMNPNESTVAKMSVDDIK